MAAEITEKAAAMEPRRTMISIITPCYNEEGNIDACAAEVARVMRDDLPGYDYEHLFYDNASTDSTWVHRSVFLRRLIESGLGFLLFGRAEVAGLPGVSTSGSLVAPVGAGWSGRWGRWPAGGGEHCPPGVFPGPVPG